ncbi:MAG: trypsin-like peptidase domain-containing protein [Anaerolineaceae bacterium]|nr:trypsin-like peptidase domain-containing protein [Anaerolineaceae bacterium]
MKTTLYAILLVVMVSLLAACQGATIPPAAVASTPVADLANAAYQGQIPTPVSADIIKEADAEYLLLENLYERLAPSVVNIEVTVETPHPDIVEFGISRASGWVLDTEGHIVTNAHVVEGAQDITVTFNDGYVATAELIGSDVFSDLAVVKVSVNPERLHPMVIGEAGNVRVGERAIAIGNPFGLASSMTVGIVSGLGRQLPSAELISNDITPGFQNPSIIQVDTDINPGNSGGPLLNSQGEVIGVNTAIRTESGVFEGVGFAVPAATVRRVVPELIEKGQIVYAWLGITVLPVDEGYGVAALAEPLGLPVDAGVLINNVSLESPASKGGLHGGDHIEAVRGRTICAGGDIIVAINGQFIANMDELVSYLVINTAPGDVVTLLIVRGKDTFEVPITLESRPEDINVPLCGQ